jgi:HSP20 family protein
MTISDLVPWKRGEKQVPVRREEERSSLSVQDEFNRLFDEFFDGFGLAPSGTFVPQVDVAEGDKEIKVSAELPGLDEKDVEVTLSNNVLTISGEKKDEKEDRGKNYYRMERSYGSFQRSISVPLEVDTDKVEATFKQGVLTVTLPKTAAAQKGKRITVKTK